jgi:LysM repeat protein
LRHTIFAATMALSPLCCHAQQVVEGGMRFTNRNNDVIRMSSGATTGLQRAGSAAVTSGGINVGSAASDVALELNPISTNGPNLNRGDLPFAGNSADWAKTLLLQRATPISSREAIERRRSTGSIDSPDNPQLRSLLQSQPDWIETITKENLKDPSKPFTNVQFTEDYDQLNTLLGQRDQSTGKQIYHGLAIYSMNSSRASDFASKSKPGTQLLAWQQNNRSSKGDEIVVDPIFKTHKSPSADEDSAINIANLQSSGSSKVFTRFTVLGFNKNPDPMAGKTSSLSAFAANTKTVGSLRATRGADGTPPSLEKISRQFGVPIQQLMQANGISDPSQDIEGLILTIPADFSTVDAIKVESTTTPTELAKLYGISVNWLLELNGIKNPDQPLVAGTSFYVPGLKQPNTIILDRNTTPSELANLYGISVSLLLSLNGLTDSQQALNAGTSFTLPSPRILGSIVLDQTESPAEIAKRFGVSTATLLDLNGLSDSNQKLGVGTRVALPSDPLLPDAKPTNALLETADYGAYTTYTVTYHLEGSLVPLFSPTLFNTLR